MKQETTLIYMQNDPKPTPLYTIDIKRIILVADIYRVIAYVLWYSIVVTCATLNGDVYFVGHLIPTWFWYLYNITLFLACLISFNCDKAFKTENRRTIIPVCLLISLITFILANIYKFTWSDFLNLYSMSNLLCLFIIYWICSGVLDVNGTFTNLRNQVTLEFLVYVIGIIFMIMLLWSLDELISVVLVCIFVNATIYGGFSISKNFNRGNDLFFRACEMIVMVYVFAGLVLSEKRMMKEHNMSP